jgi:YfiH family protein
VPPEFLESSLLARAGFRHGFFTRRGGHSRQPFDSLHFGAFGHDAATLAANVQSAAEALGVDPSRLYVVNQVHGRAVTVVEANEDRSEVLAREADVVVTLAPGSACGVKIADCVPVLVADSETGAVAAIHSGWQGTVADVVGAAIAALRRTIGGQGTLLAAIGPHIEACCFEVGDDVAAKLRACSPEASVIVSDRGPRPHVDLRRVVRSQLVASGLSDGAIDDVRGCTKCDATRFFSYRRDKEKSGRLLSAIVARTGERGS